MYIDRGGSRERNRWRRQKSCQIKNPKEGKNGQVKKQKLRSMVRDEKLLYGKYGSLEAILLPQKEHTYDRRNYEDNKKEDPTPNQKCRIIQRKQRKKYKTGWI